LDFSFTFEQVQTQTDLVWRYERYSIIRQYFDRPALFPPLIIITHFIELIKLIIRHLPRKNSRYMKIRRAKAFSKLIKKVFILILKLNFLEMIAANQEIDKDWSEFESYATNLYARTIVTGQTTSAAALVPSTARQEAPQLMLDNVNVPQLPSNLDAKAITDEIASIKKVVGDLRTYAEEVRSKKILNNRFLYMFFLIVCR